MQILIQGMNCIQFNCVEFWMEFQKPPAVIVSDLYDLSVGFHDGTGEVSHPLQFFEMSRGKGARLIQPRNREKGEGRILKF